MKIGYRKARLILSVTLLTMQALFMPITMLYAETVKSETDSTIEDSVSESEIKSDIIDTPMLDSIIQPKEKTVGDTEETISLEDNDHSLNEDDRIENPNLESPEEQPSDIEHQEVTEENLRFSFKLGEYVVVNGSESFPVEIDINQPIDSFRLTIPRNSDFSIENEETRTLLENFDNGDTAWQIVLSSNSNSINVQLSLSESGQVTVEDSDGAESAAFLYVNTGTKGRNGNILSEVEARTTVNVTTWATFRTAWNTAARTQINASSTTGGINSTPAATLNARTTPILITSATNSLVVIRGSSIHNLSNSSRTSVGRSIHFVDFEISGGVFELAEHTGSITISLPSQVNELLVTGGHVIVNAGLSVGTLRVSNGQITHFSFLPIEAQNLHLSNRYSLSNVGSLQVISVPNITISNSLMMWNRNNTTIRPTRGWQELSAQVVNNNVIYSSHNSFNNDTFNISEARQITSWGFDGAVPTPEYSLVLEAIPSTGGNPTAESVSIIPGGTTVLTANPASGYSFSHWEIVSGTGATLSSETSLSTTFTMGSGDAVVRAVYTQNVHNLTLSASPETGGSPTAEVSSIVPGGSTSIKANVNDGYRFDRWEMISGGDSATIEDPQKEDTEFTMGTMDATIQAVYILDEIDPVLPVDPLNPEVEVDPENKPELPEDQGLLSLDFVSSFNFGTQAISVTDQTYYAQPQRLLNEDGTVNENEERPNYVQISDRRPDNERNGWQLAVTQKEQFEGPDGQVLTGAQINLSNQQLVTAHDGNAPSLQATNPLALVPGNRRTLVRAEGTEGTGTWIYRFGDAQSAREAVSLTVPKGATPDATAYSTTFIWELSAVPGN